MLIDLTFLAFMILAVFKGISKGFIVAVFSLLAFIVGIAAALKLSATVATHMHDKLHVGGYWLPVLSFFSVFIIVVLVIRWSAALLKKVANIVFLGWLDTIAGILLYAIIYLMIFSVILFFANRIHLVTAQMRIESKTYSFVEPFGPKVMSYVGRLVPFFSHMFSDLSHFFEKVSKKV